MYKKPEFELKITGDDPLDHNGIDWIRLYCPYCGEYARFDAKHTIVRPKEPSDYLYLRGDTRYFHTLAVCEFCREVIYVKCFEFAYDFGYEYHYPKSIECYINIDKLNIPVSFSEAFLRLQMGDYLATVAICQKILKNMFIENGISEKINFAKALQEIIYKYKLDLPFSDEIFSLGEDIFHFFNKINSEYDHIHYITSEHAENIYGLTKKIFDIVKNPEEFIEKQKARLNARSNKIFNPQDIKDIPF